MTKEKVRHILSLSGGKDSAALAVYMHKKVPQLEYVFCDTHKELPETYEFLVRLEARLGIKITHLSSERGFDHWLQVYGGYLPSVKARWCTKQLKIVPFEKYAGDDTIFSYIGIRADEDRTGYISTKPNIKPVYPFKEAGLVKKDIFRLLGDSGIGMPSYYRWRSRSGCYFCFFQRKYEWIRLAEEHPDLFKEAMRYETSHGDGRTFYWNQGESLSELIQRREQILEDFEKTLVRKSSESKGKTLAEALEKMLEDEGSDPPCLICYL
ncbi:MAG: phosphoadenosine phosphosulfate reductase family protein [candidate division Zixibacteria bacterium]|nr:phosphoadenosine phosphosulfate reductase family protein [candidate division Zixibacteria bacterium]